MHLLYRDLLDELTLIPEPLRCLIFKQKVYRDRDEKTELKEPFEVASVKC